MVSLIITLACVAAVSAKSAPATEGEQGPETVKTAPAKPVESAQKSSQSPILFDGFGQIAAEMEEASMDRSASFLKKGQSLKGLKGKDCDDLSPAERAVLETRSRLTKVIAKAARPDLVAQVETITMLLEQFDQDLQSIRSRKGLTPETIALVELSILREKEALLSTLGLEELAPSDEGAEADPPEQDQP